jgi:hypothetical protein
LDPHIEELLRTAREATKIDKERIELFGLLVKHPGWTVYVELLEAMIQGKADEVLAPAGGVDRMVGLEYVKGAMSGLIMARDIVAVTIAAKDQIREPVNVDAAGVEEEDDE